MQVARVVRVLAAAGLAAGGLLVEGSMSAAAAQGCGPFGGEGSRIEDPVVKICWGFSNTQRVRIRRGTDSWLTVVRHGINHTMRNAIIVGGAGSASNVSTGTLYLNKTGYLIDLRGYISLTVRLPASAPLGNSTIVFPSPLGNYSLPVQVIRKGLVTSFKQEGTVPAVWGQPVTVTMMGQDISSLMATPGSLPNVGGTGTQTTQQVTFTGSGSVPVNGNLRLVLWDEALGRGIGPYGIAIGVSPIVRYTATQTGITGRTSGGGIVTGGTTTPPAVPDVSPAWSSVLLRHIAPNRKLNATFCSGMSAPATGSVTRTVTVPDVRWGVTNAGTAAVTTAFTARLQSGSTVLHTQTIQSLTAGQTVWFTYARLRSTTEVAKLGLVPTDAQRSLYDASGSDCVQVSGQATSTDWVDPPLSVVVDPAGSIVAETNKADNTRAY